MMTYPLDDLARMRATMTGERLAAQTIRRIEHELDRQNAGCTRKREYVTEATALRAGLRIGRRSGRSWRAYRCACGSWHLTTKRRRTS